MTNQGNQILCIEDRQDWAKIVTEQAGALGVNVATDAYSAANFLITEKRNYACIVLDAQFPMASMDVIVKDDKKDEVFQELMAISEELKLQNTSAPLRGVVLVHFLVRRQMNLSDILWILNSNAFNSELGTVLEKHGVRKGQIKAVQDKYDSIGFKSIFDKIRSK